MSRHRKHLSSGGTHVGVISSSALTRTQRASLYRTLELIGISNPGRRTLHHRCGRRADEGIHQMVCNLSGWRLHCHPNGGKAGDAVRQHDNDIVNASDIVIVILPYPTDDLGRSLPGIVTMAKTATDAGRKIIYLQQPRRQRGPSVPKPVREAPADTDGEAIRLQPPGRRQARAGQETLAARETAPGRRAPAPQTVAWAKLLAEQDREASQLCRRYEDFLTRYASYGLVRCERVERLWNAYASAEPTRPPQAAATASPPAPTPRKRTVDPHGGIPHRWYEDAVGTLGAAAEVRVDGPVTLVVYKVSGQVVDQYPERRGRKAADRDVARFNKDVAARKANPALVDVWR